MSSYRKFVIKVGVLFIIFLLFDFVFGSSLRKLYFSQTSGLLYRTTYSLEKTQADILIFGSSRANHHYHPDIISTGTNCSYYNVGRDGMGIMYHYALLKGILERYKPKLIILDISIGQFSKENNEKEKLSALLPYYKTHPEIRDLLYYRGPFERIKLHSQSYPFNSIIPTILVGNMEFNKSRKNDLLGYIPLPTRDPKMINYFNKNDFYKTDPNTIDSSMVSFFEEFIRTSIEKKINLIVTISPYLTNSIIDDSSIKEAIKICLKYNIPFFNYYYLQGISDNKNNFMNAMHLNEKGSINFSKMLLPSINIQLNKIREQN